MEKEEFEKKIGLLKYLADKDELDLKKQPWYKTTAAKRDEDEDERAEVDLKRKLAQDPMTSVSAHLKAKESSKKHKHHHHKKQKHKSKEESTSALATVTSTAAESPPKRAKTIEELRAERLKRESQESLRAEQLLLSKQGIKPKQEYVELDDRKRKYNSQFNPELSRF